MEVSKLDVIHFSPSIFYFGMLLIKFKDLGHVCFNYSFAFLQLPLETLRTELYHVLQLVLQCRLFLL